MITIIIYLFIVGLAIGFSLRYRLAIKELPGQICRIYIALITLAIGLLAANLIAQSVAISSSAKSGMAPTLQELNIFSQHCGLIATLLAFSAMGILINKLIVIPSSNIAELEKQTNKLHVSNYILNQTLNCRNRELENNTKQLRELLNKNHTSRLALIKSERKFRTLFDESPAIFASLDKNLTLSDINAFGARSLGYDVTQLLDKRFSKIIAANDRGHIETFITKFFTHHKPQQQTQARLTRKDQSELWVKITGSLISQHSGEKHLLLVCQDISTLKQLESKLSYQATHDPLTGLMNRYAMEAELERLLVSTQHSQQALAFIYFDVDQLKVINDTCGHLAGDRLIQQLAGRIHNKLPGIDCFARIGGDEFAIIKANCDRKNAYQLASLIRNIAEDFTFKWHGKSFRQSVSVGVAMSSAKICTPTVLIGTADAACYAAKEEGRNRVVLLENDMETSLGNRGEMQWVSRLQEAIIKNHFTLYFQPIVPLDDIHDPSYVHYEVLLRYVDEQGKHQLPSTFLSAAERFGLADQIDLWVLTTTLNYLDKHPKHTHLVDCCSINLASHSLSSYRTRAAILQLVRKVKFPRRKICFEITETSAISNLNEVAEFIRCLKSLGCRFALDDFGTGFSSFGYLKKLDVDYIKIDGCFVRDIKVDGIDRAIVTAIKSIGNAMGIQVIAEYVENNTLINRLNTMNVTLGQGNGLASPRPIEELESYYPAPETTLRLLSGAK